LNNLWARRRRQRGVALLWWLGALLAVPVIGLGVLKPGVGSGQSGGAPQPSAPAQPPAAQGQPAPTQPNPMDNALAWINSAAQVYQGVKDYTCTMVKQERVKGVLHDEHVIVLKFRVQPFSVYMKWVPPSPKDVAGQEVAYVHGKNNNMMRVHAASGLPKMMGFISISPTDPRVQQHSKHVITETGIGNLIARIQKEWQQERTLNRSQVDIAEYQFNQKPCIRIMVTLTQQAPVYCYRTVLFLDKQSHLPVRVECYDWPRQGGPPQGDLLEVYSFLNMQFNAGVGDQDFNH
jgi:hypothetical protein